MQGSHRQRPVLNRRKRTVRQAFTLEERRRAQCLGASLACTADKVRDATWVRRKHRTHYAGRWSSGSVLSRAVTSLASSTDQIARGRCCPSRVVDAVVSSRRLESSSTVSCNSSGRV